MSKRPKPMSPGQRWCFWATLYHEDHELDRLIGQSKLDEAKEFLGKCRHPHLRHATQLDFALLAREDGAYA